MGIKFSELRYRRLALTTTLRIAVMLLAATPTLARGEYDQFSVAVSLGTVLASEDICGLSYDHAKITAYIENTVPAGDMKFPGLLRVMADGAAYTLPRMSPSEKVAHCTQVKRAAQSHGFVSDITR